MQSIKVLSKEVIDKIAAGEVVQRPVSVIKELIENSLDANATCIEVQIHSLSHMSVMDDGDGITPEDLPMAAVRFATSKLTTFEDLKSIPTFGFRGEALASASMVSKVTIVSRRRHHRPLDNGKGTTNSTTTTTSSSMTTASAAASCAYRQHYKDGRPTPDATAPPTPIAGKVGTTVTIQDLFYNIPSRKRAFEGPKKEMDEYHRILNVVQRYAIHKAKDGISFLCQRRKRTLASSSTSSSRNSSQNSSFLLCDLNTKNLPALVRVRNEISTIQGDIPNKIEMVNKSSLLFSHYDLQGQNACKEVIGHIFGPSMVPELRTLSSSKGDVRSVTSTIMKHMLHNATPPHSDKSTSTPNLMNSNHSLTTPDIASAPLSQQTSSLSSTMNAFLSFNYYAYRVFGLITSSTYCVPKSSVAFILFINDRLVDCPSIKRSIENIYADTLPKGCKPFIYLSLHLPGPHVDVNVHPTKREVALLFEDNLCEDLANDVKHLLSSCTANTKTFSTQPLTQQQTLLSSSAATSAKTLSAEKEDTASYIEKETVQKLKDTTTCINKVAVSNDKQPHLKSYRGAPDHHEERKESSSCYIVRGSTLTCKNEQDTPLRRDHAIDLINKTKITNNLGQDNEASGGRNSPLTSEEEDDEGEEEEEEEDDLNHNEDITASQSKKRVYSSSLSTSSAMTSNLKRIYNPKNLVRINSAARAGAIEPFLVQRNRSETSIVEPSGTPSETEGILRYHHEDWCEFFNKGEGTVDMSQPGAFTAICRCQINKIGSAVQAQLRRRISSGNTDNNATTIQRPKKVRPTECHYASIQQLREEISSRSHADLTTKFLDSTFVGCISRQWSLIQWETELLMINHYELSREMFYQLALIRFGGSTLASLAVPVNVKHLIYKALSIVDGNDGACKQEMKKMYHTEGFLFHAENSDPNQRIAEQCTMCLRENMDMLWKNFNICFEDGDEDNDLYLVGLPVLLDGHSPPPHALPTFLMRLATEVNWSEERSCFQAVCTELGIFYAELPFDESNSNTQPQSIDLGTKWKLTSMIDKVALDCVKHRLYPAFPVHLSSPKDFAADGTVGKLATLPNLYKVFERC
jgi:DNA mismatch repair protein MutL